MMYYELFIISERYFTMLSIYCKNWRNVFWVGDKVVCSAAGEIVFSSEAEEGCGVCVFGGCCVDSIANKSVVRVISLVGVVTKIWVGFTSGEGVLLTELDVRFISGAWVVASEVLFSMTVLFLSKHFGGQ